MTAKILDGKKIAEGIKEKIAGEISGWKKKPGLATVLVGDNPASKVYVSMKNVACRKYGFYPESLGKLIQGNPSFVPCTPRGVIHLIKSTGEKLEGKHAVIIGRSNIVGKPTAILLLQENCTVTVCHSRTTNLAEEVKKADIIVAAVGKPKLVTKEMVKQGAVVIDVGTTKLADGRLCGDVDFEGVKEKASWITPVPGGVGPMTIAMLLQNTFEAAKRIEKTG